MQPSTRCILLFTARASIAFFCALTGVQAEDRSAPAAQTGWDAAVNSLLATGMYGFSTAPGLRMQLQHADASLLGLTDEAARLEAQSITFSYEGSSGLLEFSAGYILSTPNNSNDQGAVFLGIAPEMDIAFDPGRSWYLALDLSRSYQVDENISFNFGNRAMLAQNPFDTEAGQIFSLLFNMPISYKNYLTITPEFHWSQTVSSASGGSGAGKGDDARYLEDQAAKGVFYGGISISFSY